MFPWYQVSRLKARVISVITNTSIMTKLSGKITLLTSFASFKSIKKDATLCAWNVYVSLPVIQYSTYYYFFSFIFPRACSRGTNWLRCSKRPRRVFPSGLFSVALPGCLFQEEAQTELPAPLPPGECRSSMPLTVWRQRNRSTTNHKENTYSTY